MSSLWGSTAVSTQGRTSPSSARANCGVNGEAHLKDVTEVPEPLDRGFASVPFPQIYDGHRGPTETPESNGAVDRKF